MSTLLEQLINELLQKGTAQMLHFIAVSHPIQQKNVMAALVHLAKKAFVELKQPAGGTRADWEALSHKKLWVLCPFGSAKDEALMRQAAVEVLCSRTNAFCPQFRVIVLMESNTDFFGLPPICRLLSGLKAGRVRFLDLGNSMEANPAIHRDQDSGNITDVGMHVVEREFEDWCDYTNVEDACGDIAELQEKIFNSNPEVTVVKYSTHYGRGGPYIRILRDALKFNIVVHTLDLTASECGDVVGSCLASVLYTSRKLRTIILDGCSLTDVGVTQLAQSIRNNDIVRSVTLSHNPSMTDASLVAIASMFSAGSKAEVTHLDLSFNNIVYDVRFEWTAGALNTLWEALGSYAKLERINLASCGLLSQHLVEASTRWLSKGNQLLSLSLAHNYLGNEVVAAALCHLKCATHLDLEHVQLSGAGFRAVGYALAELKLPIEHLILDANNASLEHSFDFEMLSKAGCALPETMERVVLDSNTQGALYLVEALGGNKHLTKISFSRTMMGDAAVMTLCDMLINRQCSVQHVDISGNCNVEEHSAHKIKELLVGGYFAQPEEPPVSVAIALTMAKKKEERDKKDPIRTLDETVTTTGDQQARHQQLQEQGVVVVQEAPSSLPPLITSLSLASNSTAIGERALLALYQNKGLKELDLSNMSLVDAMLLPLNEAMKRNPNLCIETLRIGRNCLWYDGVANIAAHMKYSKTLRVLSLADTWAAFDDEAGRPTSLSASREEGLYYLSPILDVLSGVTTEGQQDGVPVCCPLEVLDLSGNDISERCFRGIAAKLASNKSLKIVWLLNNPLLTAAMVTSVSGEGKYLIEVPS